MTQVIRACIVVKGWQFDALKLYFEVYGLFPTMTLILVN